MLAARHRQIFGRGGRGNSVQANLSAAEMAVPVLVPGLAWLGQCNCWYMTETELGLGALATVG